MSRHFLRTAKCRAMRYSTLRRLGNFSATTTPIVRSWTCNRSVPTITVSEALLPPKAFDFATMGNHIINELRKVVKASVAHEHFDYFWEHSRMGRAWAGKRTRRTEGNTRPAKAFRNCTSLTSGPKESPYILVKI